MSYHAAMGTKRAGAPPPAAPSQPVDQRALGAALRLFVAGFVVEDKRDQMYKRLLASARRCETIEAVPRWIAVRTTPLEGEDRSPAGLEARFGELSGIQLDEDGAHRTTIAGALARARQRSSLFIGDSGQVALLTLATGTPLLCSLV